MNKMSPPRAREGDLPPPPIHSILSHPKLHPLPLILSPEEFNLGLSPMEEGALVMYVGFCSNKRDVRPVGGDR